MDLAAAWMGVSISSKTDSSHESRGMYETPGGTILYYAHRGLSRSRSIAVPRISRTLMPNIELIYMDFVFAGARMCRPSLTQPGVRHRRVRLKLFKARPSSLAVRALTPCMIRSLTFEKARALMTSDAAGFIKLNALRLRTLANAPARRRLSDAPELAHYFDQLN